MLRSKVCKTLLVLPMLTGLMIPETWAQSGTATNQQQSSQSNRVDGEWIIGLKKSKSPGKLSTRLASKMDRIAKTASVQENGETLVIKGNDQEIAKITKEMAQDPEVEFIEPNYRYYTTAVVKKPNDPDFNQQWGLEKVMAPQAWETVRNWKGPKKKSVTVAVIDTGIDLHHPDLKNRYIPGYNTLEDSSDYADDVGHGTHVAGIIAAGTNNGTGVAGLAGESPIKILPIRALGQRGGTSVSVAAGIEKAIEAKVDVINMSLGGTQYSHLLHNRIKQATDQGILVVVAAGNRSSSTDNYFPAGDSEAFTVASINASEEPSSFSNFGSAVDLAAPGENILSTFTNGEYQPLNGTSMATPFVSGAAALVKLTHPKWGPHEIRTALEKSARDIQSAGFDASTGHGLLNVNDAIQSQEQVAFEVESPAFGSEVFGQVKFDFNISDTEVKKLKVSASNKELGTVPVKNRKASLNVNTLELKPGRVTLTIKALTQSGKQVGDTQEWVLVIRDEIKQGLGITVKTAKGEPAAGTLLMLMDKKSFNPVYQGYVNEQGQAFLPKLGLLPRDSYGLFASYKDDVTDETYTHFIEVTANTKPLTIDFGDTQPTQLDLRKDGHSLLGNKELQGTFYLRPLSDDFVFLNSFSYQVEIKNGRLVSPRLAPGSYEVEVQGTIGNKEYFILSQQIEVTEKQASFAFDLDQAAQLDLKSPEWADTTMIAYDFFPAPYLPVAKNGKLYVNKGKESDVHFQIVQKQSDKVWLYRLNGFLGEIKGDRTLDLTQTPELKVREGGWPGKGTVSNGSYLFIPVDLMIGSEFHVSSTFWMNRTEWEAKNAEHLLAPPSRDKNSTPRLLSADNGLVMAGYDDEPFFFDGPELFMTDSSGNELARWRLEYETKVPDKPVLTNGLYGIHVDYSKVPLPLVTKQMKAYDVEVGHNFSKMTVLDPNGEPFKDADFIISDPETGEILDERWINPALFGENQSFHLSKLPAGKTYRFTIFGTTSDSELAFFQRDIQLQAGDMMVDLSKNEYKLQHMNIRWGGEDEYLLIMREVADDYYFFRHLGTQIHSIWLDKGTYALTKSRVKGSKPYVISEELTVSDDSSEIEMDPDYSQLVRVQIEGAQQKGTSWEIGIPFEFYRGTQYVLVEADEQNSVYVQSGTKDLQVAQSVQADQGKTITLFKPKLREQNNSLRLKVDDQLRASFSKLEDQYQQGDRVSFTLKVSDSYGNQLDSGSVQIDDSAKDLDVPLVLKDSKDGKLAVAYFNASKKEYMYISQQEIMPRVQLKKGGKLILEEQSVQFWKDGSIELPEDIEPGTYQIIWSTNLPMELEVKAQITVSEKKTSAKPVKPQPEDATPTDQDNESEQTPGDKVHD